MLRVMRKYATSWLIKILLFAIVVVFVFWGVGSFRAQRQTKAAVVNGELITMNQYRTAYQNMVEYYRRMYERQGQSGFSDEMIEALNLKSRALEELVDQELLLQEAEKLDFAVSNEQLIQTIKKVPAFQAESGFDYERYSLILRNNGLTPESFETLQRQDMLRQMVRDFIVSNAKVSDQEAWEWYLYDKTKVKVEHVMFDPETYLEIEADPEEVAVYFEENKESYKTDPERKVQFLKFSPDAFKEDVEVSEDEIETYYAENREDFAVPKTVEARHILFRVEQDSPEEKVEEVKQKALEVYEKAKSGADFAELAQTYSEGPTKDRGGLLGAFKKEDMVAPFSEKAFSMAPGDISEPVLTQFGWHIIKVEKVNEAKTSSIEEAKEEIKNRLTDVKARNMASAAAYEIYDNHYKGDNLADIADMKDLEIKTTDFFTIKKGPESDSVSNARRFGMQAFSLDILEISDVLDFKDAFYIVQVLEEKPAVVSEFETVKDEVEKDFLRDKRDDKARADAEAFLNAIGDAENPEAEEKILESFNVRFEVTEPFERKDRFPLFDHNESALTTAAFKLSEEKSYPDEVVKGTKGYHVIRFVEKIDPERETFEKEKTETRRNLLQQKQQQLFQSWLTQLREKSDIQYIMKL